MKKIVIFFTIFVLLGVIAWAGYKYLYLAKIPVSFITIDINPSVELAVNSDDRVVDVVSLNEDADIITSDLDLIGLPVEKASADIVAAAIETGYIDELSNNNTIVLTSANDDEKVRIALEEKVMGEIGSYLTNNKVYALLAVQGLNDELKTEADEYKISYGKMFLISKAVSLDSTLNKDDLVSMSIQEIQKEIKNNRKARYEAKKMNQEELKSQWQIQKQAKIEANGQKYKQKRLELWNDNKNNYNNVTDSEKEEIIDDLLKQKKEQIKNELNNIEEEIQRGQDKNQIANQNRIKYYVIKNENKVQRVVENRKTKNKNNKQ